MSALPFRSAACATGTAGRRFRSSTHSSFRPLSSKAVSYNDMVNGNPLDLPRLPIPKLDDTVTRYLQSLEPLTRDRPEDLARARAIADRFLKRDGPLLHSMVVEKDATQKGYPHSYIEGLWDDMYLEGRWSLPINSNPYLALEPPPKDSAVPPGSDPQIVGAARFISSLLKWNRRVRDGTFQPDAARPGCVRGYALQGGGARVAKKGRDTVQHYPESRHMVVFCNNRIFKVELLGGEDGQSQISEDDLSKHLDEIRSSAFSEPYGPSPGDSFVGHLLTSKGRDECAAAREALKGFSPTNGATLSEIDSAIFAVALDDHDTPDLQAESRAFLTGDGGRNRWFDKHQLVVLKNGKMAVNFEHSFSDGMDWTRMLGEIWHDMYSVESKGVLPFPKAPLLTSPPPPPRELLWKLPSELKREVAGARKEFDDACEGYTLDPVEFRDFGKDSCKEWKMSPDAVAQMAFQLAFKRLHGTMPSVYESCTTRWFHRGRTEVIRSCTTESADFVSAMESKSKGKDTLREALNAAATKHIMVAKAAAKGEGVDRHMLAMRSAAAEAGAGGEGKRAGEEFFGDPLVAESAGWRLSTSNLSPPFLSSFGFGPVAGNGYGLGYNIDGDRITVPVTAFRGGGHTDGKLMAKEVVRALREIGDVCR
ncbi:unnamed protein product [Ectocarpus sp. 12 AP-2014]